jgi:SAM-dependent methyltransferase
MRCGITVSEPESLGDRVKRYQLAGDNEDLRRLLVVSDTMAESARNALLRSGVGAGASVIECGCGPVGALPVLAELVGPGGRVVGVDMNESAVERARSVVDALGLENVRLVVGNVNDLDATALGGPFDLAFTRLFLVHQADLAAALRQIADLLTPGGAIVAQEPLRDPPPFAVPHLDQLARCWHLVADLVQANGVPTELLASLPQAAAAAGLRVERVDGSFVIDRQPARTLRIYSTTLAAVRSGAIAAGLANAAEIDGLIAALEAAAGDAIEWVSSPFFTDVIMRRTDNIY